MDRKTVLAILAILISIPPSVQLLPVKPAHAQGYPPVTITANPATITLPVAGTANTQITITSVNGYAGTTSLQGAVYPYPQVNITLNPASVTLSAGGTTTTTATVTANSTTTPATFTIRIYAHSGVYDTTYDLNATVTAAATTTPDFRLTASQTIIPVTPGASTIVTISVASLAGFNGDVNLTNAAVIGTLSPNTIHLKAGQIANATLTLVGICPFTNPNVRQPFEIDAKSGARFHWISLLYVYKTPQPTFCFDMATTQKIVIGSSGSNDIEFGTLGGFEAKVVMSAKSSLQTSFFPSNNITVKQGTSFSGEMQVAIIVPSNFTPGNYTLTITGMSGSRSWTMNETIRAVLGPYFTMTVNPTALTIPQGSSKNLAISLTGQANFQANVEVIPALSNKNLTFDISPSYTYNGLNVGTGYTTYAMVTIYALNVPVGNYTLWIQAETLYMPYVYAILIIPITVQPASPNILGLSPLVFYSMVGTVAGAGAIAATIIILQRRKPSTALETADGKSTRASLRS